MLKNIIICAAVAVMLTLAGCGSRSELNKLRMSAEKGDASAQSNLAQRYYKGEGVITDKAEAVKWYRKAAEQGLAAAQFGLGLCYYNGEGVVQDKAEAAKLLHKAAEQGHAKAQANLGWCYYRGEGVVEDFVEAYKWVLLAGAAGNERAGAIRADIAKNKKMTSAQIAEAKKRAEKWRQEYEQSRPAKG